MGEGIVKRSLDKIGVAGSLFAALCCLGFPAILSIVSAIGLGFIIKDAILIPLLVVFLVIGFVGLYLGIYRHGSWTAFGLGLISAILIFVFIVVTLNKTLALGEIAGLVAASFLNVWLNLGKMS